MSHAQNLSPPLSPEEIGRYGRQILLKEIGGPGQMALKKAKVLLVGAGGLGGPAGLYLVAAGVGTIGVVDFDVVERSNLHRQIQFKTDDIGRSKTEAMLQSLSAQNPHVELIGHGVKLDSQTIDDVICDYDLVLDGTDDFATRFVVNQACIAHHTPLISGALGRFDGQVAAFENKPVSDTDHCTAKSTVGPCYQCFVPGIPPDAPTCSMVGVMGALAGQIGAMMAMEAIKIITDAGEPLYGRVFVYDGLKASARTIGLPKDPDCPACGVST